MKQSLLFAISICLSSCLNNTNLETAAKGPDKSPGSWMYEQRAYPNGINEAVKSASIRQYKSMASSSDTRFDKSWKQVGPTNVGGRITDIALHPFNMNIIYAGSSVGGVWKSSDKGYNWDLIFDEPGGLSIGNIGISTSNPEVLYVGTGEANASATSGAFYGNGVYKTTDGGANWINVGLNNSHHIGRVVVHPTNQDIAYVAAAGTLYSKNEERGIFKTTNGGDTWDRVLFLSDSTAAIDISLSPLSPDLLFAAMWERTRRPTGRTYSGLTSGLYRSTNAGENWELMTNGIPSNDEFIGRIGVMVSPSDPSIVYSTFTTHPSTNTFLGIFKSEDSGNSWTGEFNENLSGVFSSFGWFFGNVRVHPTDPEDPYIVGFRNYNKDIDGEWQNWSGGYHVDQHAYEIHPQDPNYRVFGNDGGIYITEDGGNTIRHVETIANNQFYECKIHPDRTDTYAAGSQDNGTQLTDAAGIAGYTRINGGDGFVVQYDYINPNYLYVESQWGRVTRLQEVDNDFIRTGLNPDDFVQRTNWNTPFVTIPNEFGGILYGGESVLYSGDFGDTWQIISPDLTNGPYEGSSFGTITTLAVSEIDQNIIIAGTDDGNVQITTNKGQSWSLVSETLPNLSVSSVATDPLDESTIYVTFSGYRSSNYLPHVLRSEDLGETWTDISANLPEMPINEIVIDPAFEGVYYLATDLGVYVSQDSGLTWDIMGTDMPPVVVADLDLHDENRLLLGATFGRSMFKYDLPTELVSVTEKEVVDIKIGPNPTSGILYINDNHDIEFNNIDILDISGNVVIKSNTKQIDVSSLSTGSYILRLDIDDKIKTKSFIKI